MKNFFPPTLSRYLARVYTASFLQLLGILLGIVYLFETVELLRRAAKFENVPFTLVLEMGLLKLPEIGQIILPFAVLFSALYTFWFLVRRHELVIVRAAGLSVWQFLGPIVGVSLLIGIFHMAVINPIGALLIARYQALEVAYLQAKENTVSIGEQGLWLRQKTDDGGFILHAERVKMPEWRLTGVTVFFFTKDGDFIKRTDAQTAVLSSGNWTFYNVTTNAGGQPVMTGSEALATNLTVNEIEESFSTPEQTPFWSLPGYIKTMEATGFDSKKLRIHFQTLLAQPLLFAAMVILAATVSLRMTRFQPTALMIGGGVVIGFMVFFASSFLKALGASDQIPVILAAWFPPLIALSLGVSVILTTEDG
ncbi:MAG: LPS export ABC transporter permease LptG [Micavibrio aeruginosavorus]|uniref:LPS export ABC transporter permease LptG n=1 Tax=Micavibrio aeruginosavorus TaxID=349221 RepID=A0A2W5PRU4_9BACT|nr:MAG: LPS export ABC transporter permease LptG [Micavibrio aeruginosavorus]